MITSSVELLSPAPGTRTFFPEHLSSATARASICDAADADRFVSNLTDWLFALHRHDLASGKQWSPWRQTRLVGGFTPGAMGKVSQNHISNLYASFDEDWARHFVKVSTAGASREWPFTALRIPYAHETWSGLHQALQRWACLPDDWDGEDGVPPPQTSVENAGDFLGKLQRLNIRPPCGFVAGDGEIGFRWRQKDEFASAAFLPDGSLVAYARVSGRAPVKIDKTYNKEMSLSDFFKAISKFV